MCGDENQRNQVQLKKRAKDVLDALDQNNEQMRRVQQEKTKVGVRTTRALFFKESTDASPLSRFRQSLLVLFFNELEENAYL